jgi:hypothetical protein
LPTLEQIKQAIQLSTVQKSQYVSPRGLTFGSPTSVGTTALAAPRTKSSDRVYKNNVSHFRPYREGGQSALNIPNQDITSTSTLNQEHEGRNDGATQIIFGV